MKLQELPKEQRIIAEKIINETLFLAEMGSLTISHTVRKYDDFANTSFSTQPQIQNLSTKSHTQVIYTQPHSQSSMEFTSPVEPDHTQSDNTITSYLRNFNDE